MALFRPIVSLSLGLCLVLAAAPPPAAGLDAARLARIEGQVEAAIAAGEVPGAVVLVGRGDREVHARAYGRRALVPVAEPMTMDTVFDLASLTKVVATTTAVMLLVEEGRVRLDDPVATHLPGFERHGKGRITVRHLLTHVSGLRGDLDMALEFASYEEGIARTLDEVPRSAPGEKFVYSDLGFIALGEIVRRVSGRPLDAFCRDRIFAPLGMADTRFAPPPELRPRIAPTERCAPYAWPCGQPGEAFLRGVVHDPTARRMQGVAGHAGLFGTAADLGRFCRMLLAGGAPVLAPLTVARMTAPVAVPGGHRGLGWDVDSSYSTNRGELLPLGSYGHTGFTGTSMWIDPYTRTWVVVLANRVHPDGRGNAGPLRSRIATTVAAALLDPPPEALRAARLGADLPVAPRAAEPFPEPVLQGIDVLQAEGFRVLAGRRVGLVTNATGQDLGGTSTVDLLARAPGVKLVALFSPEHGLRGTADEKVPSGRDAATGLPVHSLYGETLRPTAAMLEGLDTLVFDLADAGARFYTYASTLAYLLEEAGRRGLKVVVLDRVNPINGDAVEGPNLDPALRSFTGTFPMPVRHGLTLGEWARLCNGENALGVDLTVVPLRNWRRGQWFDQTGVPWVRPSPNLRTLNAVTLYPGVCLLEGTNVSVGRGTDSPFEHLGAPWIDGRRLALALNARGIPGVRFHPTRFVPASGAFKGEACGGVALVVTDREALRPVRLGVELAAALHRQHRGEFQVARMLKLLGSPDTLRRLEAGEDPAAIAAGWAGDEGRWRLRRSRYLLYP